MTIEQDLKTLIGEYTFQIVALTAQLKDRDSRIAELEKKEKNDPSRTK